MYNSESTPIAFDFKWRLWNNLVFASFSKLGLVPIFVTTKFVVCKTTVM